MWYLGNHDFENEDEKEEIEHNKKKVALNHPISNSFKQPMQIDELPSLVQNTPHYTPPREPPPPQKVEEQQNLFIPSISSLSTSVDWRQSSTKNVEDEEEVFNLELPTEEDKKKTNFIPPTAKRSQEEEILLERRKMSEFFENYNCYNLIPESGKIVVLDIALAVKSAFLALEENNIKSAPLWDSSVQDYVGIITVTDFIEILLHFHKVPNVNLFEELEKHQIKTWRGMNLSHISDRYLQTSSLPSVRNLYRL